jgi:hypothetical protein
MAKVHEIIDDFGCTWKWDGRRVYCVEAEEELRGEEREQNGYSCNSWGEALSILKEGGYLENPY